MRNSKAGDGRIVGQHPHSWMEPEPSIDTGRSRGGRRIEWKGHRLRTVPRRGSDYTRLLSKLMTPGCLRVIDTLRYLQEENRVLKERLDGRRLCFTDAERCRLARKAQSLGRKVLSELETLVTPDTLLRWYRNLVARKWDYRPTFLKAHGESLTATDFLSVDVFTLKGLSSVRRPSTKAGYGVSVEQTISPTLAIWARAIYAVAEVYYSVLAYRGTHLTLDYQRIDNPGYNVDRGGPVNILSGRLHIEF